VVAVRNGVAATGATPTGRLHPHAPHGAAADAGAAGAGAGRRHSAA